LFVGEALAAILVLTARLSKDVDRGVPSLLLAFFGTFYFTFVDLGFGTPLIPYFYGQWIQMAGISLQVGAKLWLGRSFGLVPANRGLVLGGPYRFVRHPMYLGYFLNHMGYLVCTYSTRNLVVYSMLYAIQIGRIVQEERLLARDPKYEEYAKRVKWRFVPFVY
jgi:protein-S-isoprenylcysteine O-methyltransferase Ste14